MNSFEYFKEITQIPRPSKKEEKIRNYVISKAEEFKLNYKTDNCGNLLVKIPASPNKTEGVTLQGHLDMVCEKTPETEIDFEIEGIKTYEKDGFLFARGTTLGADNGVAIAYNLELMEILSNPDNKKYFEHPQIDLLFTIDEETGLTGATYLNPKLLEQNYLINLDSEEEGIIYVGCAGGSSVFGELIPEYRASIDEEEKYYTISIKGLLGGHSGADIHLERLNAIKVLNEIMLEISKEYNFYLIDIQIGDKHNVIPRDGYIKFSISKKDNTNKKKISIKEICKKIEYKYSTKDDTKFSDKLEIFVKEINLENRTINLDNSKKVINLLSELKHGVIKKSIEFENVIQTSMNLASIKLTSTKKEENIIKIVTSQRSLDTKELNPLCEEVNKTFEKYNFNSKIDDRYPAWTPNKNSKLLKIAEETFSNYNKETPKITAIHAGLECGVIGEKKDNLDMISIGPEMFDVHTPSERLNIKSLKKTFEILCEIIKKI